MSEETQKAVIQDVLEQSRQFKLNAALTHGINEVPRRVELGEPPPPCPEQPKEYTNPSQSAQDNQSGVLSALAAGIGSLKDQLEKMNEEQKQLRESVEKSKPSLWHKFKKSLAAKLVAGALVGTPTGVLATLALQALSGPNNPPEQQTPADPKGGSLLDFLKSEGYNKPPLEIIDDQEREG